MLIINSQFAFAYLRPVGADLRARPSGKGLQGKGPGQSPAPTSYSGTQGRIWSNVL